VWYQTNLMDDSLFPNEINFLQNTFEFKNLQVTRDETNFNFG